MGRHSRTEPMQAVRPTAPPIDPEPNTATMPRLTPADITEWDRRRAEMTAEEWMADLTPGGTRVEHRMRATFRERGLILAKRVGRQALKLRQALARSEKR